MLAEKYDLHCHTTASDGGLNPRQLVERAKQQGVTVLAITDHDTTCGLAEAKLAADQMGIKLIYGIELSSNFHSHCLHIIGLNIDPNNPILMAGLARQQAVRAERAIKIAQKLEKKRIPGAYAAVVKIAGNGEITRSHFADFLVAEGHVQTQQEAFDRYLSKGMSAYVPTIWAELPEVINWIKQSGGVAVLAHPMRYKLSHKWMHKVLQSFSQFGGQGIEVVTGRASDDEIRCSREFAEKYQLYASTGSDFHIPENQWLELGRLAALPSNLLPVWQLF